MILRAGLYERVSSDEQAKFGFSIKTQIDALNEHTEKNGMKVVDHYTDDGVSGGKAAFKRPEMSRLLEDVKAGKVDIILFTRLDRWFRNVPEYFKVQEILDAHGVQWKAIWEDYDTTTSNGRMAITIFLAIAQNEREKGSERVKVVFDNKIKNKEALFNWKSMPFGYTKELDEDGIPRLVKDPDLEDAVATFWDMLLKYENVYKAGTYVNMAYGLHRNMKGWYDVAYKEIYTGRYKGVLDYCDPYVSHEDWLKVQKRRVKRAQRGRVYLFAGLIKCPHCGRILTSKSSKQKLASGKVVEYRQYCCKRAEDKLCDYRRHINEAKVEKWLLGNLAELMKDEIARVNLERTKPKKKQKVSVAKLREQLRRLNVAYMAGNMEDEEYIDQTKELNALIIKAEAETAQDPGEKDLTALKSVMETDFQTIYQDLDSEDKRRFWRSLIEEIHVNEKPEVTDVDFL
jgi:DNA invertase Pin-like site-specific DNA recombinase